MKKTIIIFIYIAFAVVSITVFANQIFNLDVQKVYFKIEVNGKEKKFEMPIVTINGRTYLPLRELAETLGIGIEWIGEEQKSMVTMESIIGQIALVGSFSDNYLFDVYLDKKVKITSANHVLFRDETKTFEVGEVKKQIEISITQEQFDDLLNCVDDFINEDLGKIEFKAIDPSPNFNIISMHGEKIKRLAGDLFISVDENGNYIQTKMAHNLMLILNEISSIPITYVKAPY